MKLSAIAFITLIMVWKVFSQDYKIHTVSDNLKIISLSDHAFVHVSYSDSEWGHIASNGLILVQDNKAFLFDTPMDEPTTKELVRYIADSLKSVITGFIPNHWHADCIGGLAFLHSLGIISYANNLTIKLAKEKGLEIPKQGFNQSLDLLLGKMKIVCYFPGAAHTMDNIVVWIPDDKILFGGCMVKELKINSMGNFADGDLKAWPGTIKIVMDKFPSATIVIPGHGDFGGFELLQHSYELAMTNANK